MMGYSPQMHEGWHDLSSSEKNMIRDPQDVPIYYVLENLSPQERSQLYGGIRIKPEYFQDFRDVQGPWMGEHEYLLGLDLFRKGMPCSHSDINEKVVHVRCKLFYTAKHPERVEPTSPEGTHLLESFIQRVEEARNIRRF